MLAAVVAIWFFLSSVFAIGPDGLAGIPNDVPQGTVPYVCHINIFQAKNKQKQERKHVRGAPAGDVSGIASST
jgi:hypothetical protein